MHSTSYLSRRTFALGAVALAAGTRLASGTAPVMAQDDGMNQPDGTYLFGSGEDLMPTVPVRWRIIEQTAKPVDEAPELARTLNFLTPISDVPIIVDNFTTGESTYVPAHVAASAFGAEGDVQKRWVEQDEPAPYVAFELIVADQDTPNTIGTGTWLGSTDPFTAPKGTQEMEMAALVVDGQSTQSRAIPEFSERYPLVGYVYQNDIAVIHADDTVTEMPAGETFVFANGDVIEYAGSDARGNASVYFARFVVQRTY